MLNLPDKASQLDHLGHSNDGINIGPVLSSNPLQKILFLPPSVETLERFYSTPVEKPTS
jgi:hypothetical protein